MLRVEEHEASTSRYKEGVKGQLEPKLLEIVGYWLRVQLAQIPLG
jgi:hypothetical protein